MKPTLLAALAAALALAAAAGAGPPAKAAAPAPPGPPMPTDAQCPALPAVRPPFAFSPGEVLDYDLDAMGMSAGKLTMSVRPVESGTLPIHVEAASNTLFSKVRKVKGEASSWLDPRTLRPVRYFEDATQNGERKISRAQFHRKEHRIDLAWENDNRPGKNTLQFGPEGLDTAGAIYLMRALPLKAGTRFCTDVFALRRIWRLVGTIEAREHVSLPLGEFDAWHFSGMAIRADNPGQRREVHIWLSDDARRLPLVVVGTIDLGAVRATLTAFKRPGEKRARAENPKEKLKW